MDWWAASQWLPHCTDQIIGPGAVRPLAPHSRASVPAATAGPARHIGRMRLAVRIAGNRAAVDPDPPPRGPDAMIGAATHSPSCCGRLGPSHSCRRPPSESRHDGPAGRTTEGSPLPVLTGGHATRHGPGQCAPGPPGRVTHEKAQVRSRACGPRPSSQSKPAKRDPHHLLSAHHSCPFTQEAALEAAPQIFSVLAIFSVLEE